MYKRTYTKEDEILVNWYVFYVLKGELFLRVHEKNTPAERFSYRKLRSGANVNTGIGEALFFDKNNGDSHKYIVELIVKEPSGNISTVYYTDNTDKKYGITFDIFNRAKTAYTEAVKKDLNVEFKM